MKAFVVLVISLFLGGIAVAEEGRISVELNKLETEAENCQSYLVLQNGTANAFDRLVLDLVMFDVDGIIARRLAVDIAPLDASRVAVKVFAVQGFACESISRMLVNGVLGCEAGGAARDDCRQLLAVSSRSDVDLVN